MSSGWALGLGVAGIAVMYSWRPTRPLAVAGTIIILVGLVLSRQGTFLSQLKQIETGGKSS